MEELRAVWPDETLRQRMLMEELARSLKPKRALAPARKRRVAKAKTRKDEWAQIREAVLERANGVCEHCRAPKDRLAADHMFSGNGRRLSLQSKFTVWGLCFHCDQRKTRNDPDASFWLRAFVIHAERLENKVRDAGLDADALGYRGAAYIAAKRLSSLTIQKEAGSR